MAEKSLANRLRLLAHELQAIRRRFNTCNEAADAVEKLTKERDSFRSAWIDANDTIAIQTREINELRTQMRRSH